jgi:hypothetical protein
MVHAASFVSDFNSGLPAGTTPAGSAGWSSSGGVGGSGMLRITSADNSLSGGFAIPDFAGGIAITNFRAKFKLLIGGDTCCDGDDGSPRPADGMSFSYSAGMSATGPWLGFGPEDGGGSGISVAFDTWDNNGADSAPSIELITAGTAVAVQSMGGWREGNRAPATPVQQNGSGSPLYLYTVGPAPLALDNFVDVVIELFADNTMSLSWSNITIFNHVAVPYTPVGGGSWVFGARTGGANAAHLIDNLEIIANYVPGPVSIVQTPANQTVTESQTATFSVGANGTPPFGYQWYSNNVAIAGATFASYTTPASTLAMNGTLYHVVVSGGEGSPVTSEDALLTVNGGVIVQNVGSRINTNHVYVTYSKNVTLGGTYTLDNGATVDSVAYGSSHSEVVLTTSQLTSGTVYALTISNVSGEDATSILPNPTVASFTAGVGGVCTDFSGPLPANTTLKGGAAFNADGSLHLTEAGAGLGGGIVYSGYDSSASIDRLTATFTAQIGLIGNIGAGADGFSFNLAGDLPATETGACDPVCAEGGVGSGFTVTIDTWDDGSANDPSIDVIWHNQVIGHHYFDRPNGIQLERDHFVPVAISLAPDGKVNVSYDGIAVFTDLQLPNFAPIFNPKLGLFARTGGAFENHYIDDLCVSHNYTLGPLFIVNQPADASAVETHTASFQLVLDGSPPYNIQWYSNDVAIAGATGLAYTTPALTTGANGTRYKAVVNNGQNSVTTRDAILTVTPGVVLQTVSSRNDSDKIYVTFSKPVALASGSYAVNNGVVVASRAYGASHAEVVLTLTAPLVRDTSYTVTVSGVQGEDASPLVPDPSNATFRFGFGTFCTDFNIADFTRPEGTLLQGTAYVTNGVLRLTEASQFGVGAALIISNRTGGLPLDRLYASWDMLIRASGQPADGVSFTWGPASGVSGCCFSEEGGSQGLAVLFDTYPNNAALEPRMAVKWNGVQFVTRGPLPNTVLAVGTFVPVQIAVDPDGTVDVWYNNSQIFTNVPIPGFAPIANSAFQFGARTGGLAEDAWIDNLCINNFSPGPLAFVSTPTDATVVEGLPVTFSSAVSGSPQYRYQWFKDNVAIAGANQASYTIAAVTGAMNGSQYKVQVSNDFSVVTSPAATLTVTLNPRVVSVVACGANQVSVNYSRPVDLDSGGYDFGGVAFEAVRDYGASHSQVIVTLDTPLTANNTFSVTILDVTSEGAGPTVYPNPTTVAFRYSSYTPTATDFNAIPNTLAPAAIGNNMTIYGGASVSNGIVHITDAANDQHGSLVITNINGGAPVDRFVVRYRGVLSGADNNPSAPFGGGNPADGYSFNIANNLPPGATGGDEGGYGNGLTVTFDNWDNFNSGGLTGNANAEAPSVQIKWNGVLIRTTTDTTKPDTFKTPTTIAGIIRTPNTSTYRDYLIDLEPDGKVYVEINGVVIYNGLQTPFNGTTSPMANAMVGFYGRTGGANENVWIDDLQINAESTGAPLVARQPDDATVPELGTATFSTVADGLPPYSYQWYSNNVAIPGATTRIYTTPTVYRTMEGTAYKVVIATACGAATSRDAILHVVLDNIPATVLWAAPMPGYNAVLTLFSETLDPASATTPGNYSVNNGLTVTSATILAGGRLVQLGLSGTLDPANCNVLTVNGVKDVTTYNTTTGSRTPIQMGGASQASGANNLVVIEAEAYSANRSPGLTTANSRWVLNNVLPGSVNGYMDATPNTGAGSGDTASTLGLATSLDYPVNFPVAGIYYIWARGSTANDGGNNSFQLTVDGVSQGVENRQIGNGSPNWGLDPADVNKFGWVNHANANLATRATINIATPGVHLLSVVMREDGFKLDRFLLTTDSTYSPGAVNDAGPAASAITPQHTISLVRDAAGNATLSWPGAGWVLQGTAELKSNPSQTSWQDLPFPSGTVIPVGYFGPGQTNVFFRLICK